MYGGHYIVVWKTAARATKADERARRDKRTAACTTGMRTVECGWDKTLLLQISPVALCKPF